MNRNYLLLLLLLVSLPAFAQYGQSEATPGSLAATHVQDGQAAILAKDFAKAVRQQVFYQ